MSSSPEMASIWVAVVALCLAVVVGALRLRRVHAMRPLEPRTWPLTERFAPCAGQCLGEQAHFLHRDGSLTCQQCSTNNRWSTV